MISIADVPSLLCRIIPAIDRAMTRGVASRIPIVGRARIGGPIAHEATAQQGIGH